MKQLSYWAQSHKRAARVFICFVYLFLNVLGLFAGDLLYSMGIELGYQYFYIAAAVTLAALLYYPRSAKKKSHNNFYFRQKVSDFSIGVATFLFIVFTGNYLNRNQMVFNNQAYGVSIMDAGNVVPGTSISVETKDTRATSFSKKNFRKYMRSVVKNARKKYQDANRSQKTLYIILAVIGALLLLYVLAGLSCSIMCSGSEALGYIVLFAGGGAIIYFLVRLIKRISRGKPVPATQTQ